jgi:hypothetical protein
VRVISITLLGGCLYLTAIVAYKFGKGTYCVYPNTGGHGGGCASRGSGADDGNDNIRLKL